MFFYAILSIHIILCVVLVGLVLLQQGKGADMGAAFGGGSNTLFGAGGATAMITKITTGIAVAFFITSLTLVVLFSKVAPASRVDSNPIGGSVMEHAAEAPAAAAPAASGEANSNPAPAEAVPAQAEGAAPADGVNAVAPADGSNTDTSVK